MDGLTDSHSAAPQLTVDPKLVPPSTFVEHKKRRRKEEAGKNSQAHGHGDLRVWGGQIWGLSALSELPHSKLFLRPA